MPTSGAGPNAKVINLSAMAMCAMTSSCNVAMEVGSAGAGECGSKPRIVTQAGADEIGDEVIFEIVGHGFQHRAATRQIMALAGGSLMLA
jgi:hypothetical protein